MNLCGFDVGLERPLFLIAGPDTLESEQLCLDVAGRLREHTGALGMPYIFKGSFDKANRTSGKSYRGPGMEEGLRILASVRKQIGVPVLTDVHEDTPLGDVAAVVDVIQTPASSAARPTSSAMPRHRARRSTSRRASFSPPGR